MLCHPISPPQMVRLYRDPEGTKIFTHVTKDPSNIGPGTLDEKQVYTLQRKVKQLEAQLSGFGVSCLDPQGKVGTGAFA